jgi:hypothetical protein
MPRLCSFYGIVIAMFYNDHPPAHFHATYVGEEIRVNIDTLEILSGSLTRRAGDGLGVGVAAPRRPRGVLGASPRAPAAGYH